MVGDQRHIAKKYDNAITRHEQNRKKLSHAISVGEKLKQTEDRKIVVVSNIVSIVSSPLKISDLKKVHAIKDLLQCIISSSFLVFALYLNQISHLSIFPTSHMMTKRTRNQTEF